MYPFKNIIEPKECNFLFSWRGYRPVVVMHLHKVKEEVFFSALPIGKKVCRVIRRQYTNNKTDLITEMRL